MNLSKTLIYDGSFNGFLTAVFIAFDERINVADIQKNDKGQNVLFSETETIFTNVEKAKRVWNGIRNKNYNAITNIYFAFLSEEDGVELLLYTYIQKLMATHKGRSVDYSDGVTLRISQLSRSVGREKHRMEAFVRFQLTKDNIYFANIEPDFDVLPLISKHFRNRYADQQWLIYDVKRRYGIYYDLQGVEIVSLDLNEIHFNRNRKSKVFAEGEYDYQELWNNYFKSTHIKSRINRKLHRQHVPKRYWKYLSEKKEAV
ncbi:TIGR03915 family putative DNA repair protein [Allomuricauda sp. SCSIO 65647]|uniref:TIGR03915 family putative DNA repair protein n=1 Tax=Allomuricauda sp. SCSIO 65647 TaxID=2908843 RepID=UPI001F283C8F|nr:TIGR03915 family putative DNA repair protein [Muricauda sp. SCSIO 65647]UJH67442.1 TIGR03915 family putative DNA repair protein [Muricauda sp. SCSIO 65647]